MSMLTSHTERINFRLDQNIKQVIERAAAIRGQSLTDFAVATLEREARAVVSDHEMLVLSDKDRDAFLKALDNPPAPSENLRRAAMRYKAAARAGQVR